MTRFSIRVKSDGRLDIPKQMIELLGSGVKRVGLAKKGKTIVVTVGSEYETAKDGRFRLAAYEVGAIGLAPGDFATMKYEPKRNQIIVSA
jgi:hypothetical protein